MVSRFRSSAIPAPLMDRVHMAIAVAREQVLDEHLRSAIQLVEEGRERAPVTRLIAAYARLHHLSTPLAERLRGRVLATLGRAADRPHGPLHGPRSLLGRLRYRLRGRVNPELRAWVERHTARVELTLVEIHRDHALELVRLLEGQASAGEAVALYTELMELRSAVGEMVRMEVLDTLYDRDAGRSDTGRTEDPRIEGRRTEGRRTERRRAENSRTDAGRTRGPIPFRAAENDR